MAQTARTQRRIVVLTRAGAVETAYLWEQEERSDEENGRDAREMAKIAARRGYDVEVRTLFGGGPMDAATILKGLDGDLRELDEAGEG
jgi:hypothetical protein